MWRRGIVCRKGRAADGPKLRAAVGGVADGRHGGGGPLGDFSGRAHGLADGTRFRAHIFARHARAFGRHPTAFGRHTRTRFRGWRTLADGLADGACQRPVRLGGPRSAIASLPLRSRAARRGGGLAGDGLPGWQGRARGERGIESLVNAIICPKNRTQEPCGAKSPYRRGIHSADSIRALLSRVWQNSASEPCACRPPGEKMLSMSYIHEMLIVIQYALSSETQ